MLLPVLHRPTPHVQGLEHGVASGAAPTPGRATRDPSLRGTRATRPAVEDRRGERCGMRVVAIFLLNFELRLG